MTAWAVPGRIEVLGKHTDYGGGRVLVCAVERGVTVRAEPIDGPEGRFEATSTAFPGAITLDAGTVPSLPDGHWGRYVQTVIDRLTANFGALPAARLTIDSDLPPASGMSSSSAVLTGTALALADLAGLPDDPRWSQAIPDRLALAGYAASIENGKSFGSLAGLAGVGTSGGSLDHTGMLASEQGMITDAEFDPVRVLGRTAMPSAWVFVVAVSGLLAEKTGAAREAYNRGPASLARTLAAWNRRTGRADASVHGALRSLVGDGALVGENDAAAKSGLVDGLVDGLVGRLVGADPAQPLDLDDPRLAPLRDAAAPGYDSRRLAQFIEESAVLVPAARRALEVGDAEAMGRIVACSQGLAEMHLGNQVPATIALVEQARGLGAIAASAFGAGFGGSVWAIVPRGQAEGFADAWLERYRGWLRAEGMVVDAEPSVLVTGAAAPARRLDD